MKTDQIPEKINPQNFPGKLVYGRIIRIDRLLRSEKFPPLSILAGKFGVSQRTVERDIEAMRDYFGAPVQYDRVSKTYKYSDKNYRLPTIKLTQEELVSILISERLLRQHAGTPFEPIIQQTFNKLVAMLPDEACLSVDVANLCKAVVFEQGVPIREYSFPVFTKLLEAIIRRQRIEMVYYTLQGNREEGTRFVDPYHIANWGGDWFLIAFCMRRRGIYNFHLARIRDVFNLNLKFESMQNFDVQKHIGSTFVKIAGDDRENTRIKVLPSASTWVREKVWHFTQKFEKLEDDGSIILKMDTPRDSAGRESLRRWILQFGDEAEVLEPAWLRKEISEKLGKANSIY